MSSLDEPIEFWNSKWIREDTGWDIGYASPAISEYIRQYSNKEARILIPGCGNAYEAEFLAQNGFTDITLLDIAPTLTSKLQRQFNANPAVTVLCEDFFHHRGQYDLIIEQTFFCAISPDKRMDYVEKSASLLNPGGKIAGLLFDRTFDSPNPPFGGDRATYQKLFDSFFRIHTMTPCFNSIPPRANAEVFIILQKRSD
jgi:SAM-dependent methyltransferase